MTIKFNKKDIARAIERYIVNTSSFVTNYDYLEIDIPKELKQITVKIKPLNTSKADAES